MKPYTSDEINQALSRVEELRLTTPHGPAELDANGLPLELMGYAMTVARMNLERWRRNGVSLTHEEAFAAGWMDALLVGMALRDVRST